jgi:hypothetical protein
MVNVVETVMGAGTVWGMIPFALLALPFGAVPKCFLIRDFFAAVYWNALMALSPFM